MSTKYQGAAKRRLEIKPPAPSKEKQKKAEEFANSTRGKVGKVLNRREAPINDIDELITQIKSRGKTPWGGLAGYVRKNLKDVGMGQTTKKKINSAKPKTSIGSATTMTKPDTPVEGVGIGRKPVSRTNRRATRSF